MSKGSNKASDNKEAENKDVNVVDEALVDNNEAKAEPQNESEEEVDDVNIDSKQQEVDDEKAEVEPEVDDFKDKYIRLSAEFDNYRRRTLNEKINLTKTASESVITKLLPVIDDFDRAMTAMKETKDCDALHSGIELIYGKLNEFLTQQGVKVIDAFEKEFDTDLHEALTKIPAPKKKLKNKVVDVIEKGYTLNDKVIRFSKVVIGE